MKGFFAPALPLIGERSWQALPGSRHAKSKIAGSQPVPQWGSRRNGHPWSSLSGVPTKANEFWMGYQPRIEAFPYIGK